MDNVAGRFLWGGYENGKGVCYPRDWYTLDSRVILLKGGPGTGKSTLMRRVLAQWREQGREALAFHCAADPDSLDAVCTVDRRLCVMDATPPHAVEPRFPGAVEHLADLGEGLSREKLRGQLSVLTVLSGEQQALRMRAGQYLRAASTLARQEETRGAEGSMAEAALLRCANRLARRTWGDARGEEGERRAYLSGVTPRGGLCFYDTLTALCPQVYVLEGDPETAARLLSMLRQKAAMAGVAALVCPCALRPDRVEHLLLPETGVAFTTSHRFHEVDFPVYRRLSMLRYRARPLSEGERQRREQNRLVQEGMLSEATALLRGAQELHRQEEQIYASAMDWEQVEEITVRVLRAMT